MTNSTTRPASFTVRDEADVLALIPYTFGFHPRSSLVLMAVGASVRPFHARVDLPQRREDGGDLAFVVEQLVEPAVNNRADGALVVVYTADRRLASRCVALLSRRLSDEGIATLMAIRADAGRWHRIQDGPDRGVGVPYDLSTHVLTTRSVLEGRVTFGTREELASSLAEVDSPAAERLWSAYAELRPLPHSDRATLLAEGRWLMGQVEGHLDTGERFQPDLCARVIRALEVKGLRDLVWAAMTQDNAGEHVRLWREVVRGCGEELVAQPAALLGFAAWLHGDGALAWCAVERALAADPAHTLARLVSRTLEAALPPSTWEPVDPGTLELHDR